MNLEPKLIQDVLMLILFCFFYYFKFFFLKIRGVCACAHVCVSVSVHLSAGTHGDQSGCQISWSCVLNSGPLEKRYMLVTSEPFLWPLAQFVDKVLCRLAWPDPKPFLLP